MTRLKELRLHGFKTFADPTRFVFERGVTAVIGPNGSGKSNMADAVRWVLGEQSNRSLRTRRADDVIFAGSEGRRPQGMAEAILTLDNGDGWLPIEFAEVSIGRRAYRSGESEYLINGTRARLKEVVELLAGGRLGANELVVVGQGTVDAALSLRPDERRQLFEEAAGVKNLQVHKNEALGRLARARDNLTRVSDLIGELKPQVRRLSQQAQHQQEHDSLGRRARALIVEAHRRREVIARGSLGDARRRMAAADAALDTLRAEEAAVRQATVAAEGSYWAAEAAARKAAEGREASREALIWAEAGAEAAARRHADLADAIARAEAELSDAIGALEARPEQPGGDAEAIRRAAGDAEALWRTATAELDALDPEITAAEHAVSAARAEAATWVAEAARRDETSARAVARAERIERELRSATTALAGATAAVEGGKAELAAAEAGEKSARERRDAVRAAAVEAEERAAAERVRATALAERLGGLRAELEMLHERAEGGARLASVLAAAGWRALLEDIDPPQDAWAAVETLVGGELQQALIWRDDGVIDHAAAARGLVRLLADGPETDGADEADERAVAFAAVRATRTLAEWIGSSSGQRIFSRTAVAPDLESLLAGWRRLPSGWSAVTADGDLADGRGLVLIRGRQEGSAGEAARQHARRRELAEMLEGLEIEQAEAGQSAAQALVAWTSAQRERETTTAKHVDEERRLALARDVHDRAAEAATRAHDAELALTVEMDQAQAEIAAGRTGSGSPSPVTQLEELLAVAADAHARQAGLAAERDKRREAWQTARSAADVADAAESGSHEQAMIAARREQLAASIAADRESLVALDAERAASTALTADAAAADKRAADLRAAADAERERLRAELLQRERAGGGTASRLGELEREVQSTAIEAQRLEDELVAIGRERDLGIESLPPSSGEAPDTGSENPSVAEMADVDQETVDAELTRVRRTLAQIGSVNPFAIEEHRELDGRLQALAVQDTDLSAAIASTEELIGRLDSEIAGQFNAAFVAIGAKFDEFCRLLFAGGSASLQMSEGGDAEVAGGIEIAVQPPGKRLQRLAMLSGGERALAGVALLFAMLSVNPVPFCILDEVDAALDEANIGRFAEALRQLARQIDFVVITHNRATIETADTIYGVTMTDAAVSRLLSLRLADLPVEAVVG
ncbi:MAG: chromosome segregation protein SMC [Chloroflexota bacterium]